MARSDYFHLVSCVGERPWWPILQSPEKEESERLRGGREGEIRSSLLVVDLKDGKL